MKQSTKAALLSGLIFPGIGHLAIKQYMRAGVLIVIALVATTIYVNAEFQQALAIVDGINNGTIPLDATSITELAAQGADSPVVNNSFYVLVACWLIGIVDSYRLGNALEKKQKI